LNLPCETFDPIHFIAGFFQGGDMVVLMAARASRLENQDAIDAAIVSMLADPKEVVHLAN
jgi:hypothetical protein